MKKTTTYRINKTGIIKKVAGMRITDGTNYATKDHKTLLQLERSVDNLKEEIAEMILLESQPEAVSVFDMSCEEYVELPGNVRL